MKKSKFWLAILTAAVMLSSCALAPQSASNRGEFEMEDKMAVMPAAEAPVMEFAADEIYEEEFSGSDFETSGVDVERIVIKNTNLSIAVPDPASALESITDMAEAMGGFVVYSNLYKTTTSQGLEVPTANLTIRVPAEKLDQALEEIKGLVEEPDIDILSEDTTGEDVTSQVTDLESRLRNLEAAEVQLLEIMESAKKTEDVITIFRELTSVREEIELIQGQIKYYRESARLSAISIYLQAKAALEPITIGGWNPGIEAQKALQALVDGGQFIVDMLIWLVIFAVPILAIIFLPIFLIIRAVRKRKKKKDEKSEPKSKKVA